MHKRKMTLEQLYLREYPLLIEQAQRLIALVRENDPNVACLALFGSTARLTPRASSDADVLALVRDMRQFYPFTTSAQSAPILALAREAEELPSGAFCRWPFSLVPGDVQGQEIDPEFLKNVAEHGVLLYHQPGASLPSVLSKLQPFAKWQEQVQALLHGSTAPVQTRR